ncbi:Branched-chain-amino-acid aminotransferase [Roseovarius albus]|uniref:Probable branched-chain-amino-acid aminotransferase n=1 Tax=Roseovarius albus TaxID=1247867 RepID=A0A1X6Y768_9RHOB|nr:aminotransferase class IV [Roseovarius albus]SLN12001.1 Branched-chain-amino-acid aminotransferase [Roseovarius albus]
MSNDTFPNGAAWIKGEVVPIEQAAIGVTDWAVTHSDVTYDVVPVWDGAFFRLNDYLGRFEASMRAYRMDVGMDRSQIASALHDMVARSGLKQAYVAMVAARGTPRIAGSRDPRDCDNHFYAWCVPYIHVVKPEVAAAGVSLYIPDNVHRIPDQSLNQRVKNYHWGDFTAALFQAKDNGFESALLTDGHGNLAEGPGFNVFAIFGDKVVTPAQHVLHGITRRTALELCRENGFETEERALPLSELMEADEMFLTSSGGGIFPVARVNAHHFSNGAAGPKATQLRAAYYERLKQPGFRTEITY